MQLLNSEPFGALVKSTVEVEGKHIHVYHLDLPPDLTGVFDVAYRLHTEPKPKEPAPDRTPIVEKVDALEPVVIPQVKLDAAVEVASKLNRLGVVSVEKEAELVVEVKK